MVVRTIKTTYEESNRIADDTQTCIFRNEKEGYSFRVMYFDKDHKVCKAELKGDVDDPQDTLQYFYDLFKAEHEFESYAQLKEFFDRFKVTDE